MSHIENHFVRNGQITHRTLVIVSHLCMSHYIILIPYKCMY